MKRSWNVGLTLLLLAWTPWALFGAEVDSPPLRVGVVGLIHTHVHGILGSARSEDAPFEIVGIAEPDQTVVEKYRERYDFDPGKVYAGLESMLEGARPEAVAVFTDTFSHPSVVEVCAARGVHVMMEKPLAVSMEHAQRIAAAAREHPIHVLVNYETTWYRSHHEVRRLLTEDENPFGPVRRMVAHHGHQGPIEIGCPDEFVDWLTDPQLNGGGALTDFGCYGANLMTWMMGNVRPLTVTAVTQQIKPDRYPKVEDEATIVMTYPRAQGIIQASWNWNYNRKDLEIYGTEGYAHTSGAHGVRLKDSDAPERFLSAPARPEPNDDPWAYLVAVVRGEIDPDDGLSSLKNNLIVTEILDAARRSAASGRSVNLREDGERKE